MNKRNFKILINGFMTEARYATDELNRHHDNREGLDEFNNGRRVAYREVLTSIHSYLISDGKDPEEYGFPDGWFDKVFG